MNGLELTGRARTHIVELREPRCTLHSDVVAPYLSLRRAAALDGIDLVAHSSFRDFSRQLTIWNGKYSGERQMLSAAGARIDAASLAPAERVATILLWSALPGASRHHWGTDVDFVDGNAIAPDYAVQLNAAEFAAGGPFARLTDWLAQTAPRFGFFRPGRGVRSGVQPEAWHFSFAPIAENARRALTAGVLREAIEAAPLLGKECVLANLEELHARYVARIDLP